MSFDFAEWISELGHGSTNKQAGDRLRELVQACQETGKKGQLQLTISVETKGSLVDASVAIKTTKPEPSLPGGSYYVNADGALVTEDPRQLNLPTRAIPIQPIRGSKGD